MVRVRVKPAEFDAFQYEPGMALPEWIRSKAAEIAFGSDNRGGLLKVLHVEGISGLVRPFDWVIKMPTGLCVYSAEEFGEGFDIVSCEEGML